MPCYDTKENNLGLLNACIWRGETIPCSQIFRAVPSDIGMCCAFNMKKAEEILEEGQYRISMTRMQLKDIKNSNGMEKSKDFKQMDIEPQVGRTKGKLIPFNFSKFHEIYKKQVFNARLNITSGWS